MSIPTAIGTPNEVATENKRTQNIKDDLAEVEVSRARLELLEYERELAEAERERTKQANEKLTEEKNAQIERAKKKEDDAKHEEERAKKRADQEREKNEKKIAKQKSDRLWGYSKMSIAAVVAVVLLIFFVMYKINEGQEAARVKLPDAYTKIFNGPLLGKAVQGTVSFTGMEKDRVETCASICKKMFSCRGFNYKAEKCEIVTSESIFATVVDSPGSAAYEKK
jgi:Fe2+ transport system protein B